MLFPGKSIARTGKKWKRNRSLDFGPFRGFTAASWQFCRRFWVFEEFNNNSNKEKEITAVVELFKNIGFAPRQKCYINEIFPIRVRADTPRTIPDLEERGVGPPMDKCISYLC